MTDLMTPLIAQRLEEAGVEIIKDPGGRLAKAAATHEAAHQQLARTVALDRSELTPLTPRRARNHLRKLRGLMRILDKTDHVCERASDIPCREERHRVVDPVLAELEKLAKPPHRARRERTAILTTKERPMTTETQEQGRVRDETPEEAVERRAQTPTNGHANPANLPGDTLNEHAGWARQFQAPNFSAVREAACRRLAVHLLDRPPAAQRELLTRLLYMVGMERRR